ncbi:MAG: hypothetical protein DWQ36_14210 [Acidobacteria bacterium]|nr:MAG: hypothetical protein DWQ30_19740 [Acidobacteriota bacterium]REK06358.1 MAG: hypothetical protein DWQ36_14210 [Acidobacteriota bacterium]
MRTRERVAGARAVAGRTRRGGRTCLLAALLVVWASGCNPPGEAGTDAASDPAAAAAEAAERPTPAVFTSAAPVGFDVSHHQDEIDWPSVASDQFVYIKLSEGVDYVDPLFAANWGAAAEHGVLRGAYHMFRPEDEVPPQVEWFVSLLQRHGFDPTADLPPALDLESNSGVAKVTPELLRARAEEWLREVQARLRVRPVVYTNPSFWRDELEPEHELVDYPLWVAAYSDEPSPPPMENGWTGWTFWQHSENGAVAGVAKPVDLNRFHADGATLRRFVEESVADTAPAAAVTDDSAGPGE